MRKMNISCGLVHFEMKCGRFSKISIWNRDLELRREVRNESRLVICISRWLPNDSIAGEEKRPRTGLGKCAGNTAGSRAVSLEPHPSQLSRVLG